MDIRVARLLRYILLRKTLSDLTKNHKFGYSCGSRNPEGMVVWCLCGSVFFISATGMVLFSKKQIMKNVLGMYRLILTIELKKPCPSGQGCNFKI